MFVYFDNLDFCYYRFDAPALSSTIITPPPLSIYRRRCRRYFPTEPDEQLREFLRDRYLQSVSAGTLPPGPFCYCGLQRSEHRDDALAAAPPDVEARERHLLQGPSPSKSRTRVANAHVRSTPGVTPSPRPSQVGLSLFDPNASRPNDTEIKEKVPPPPPPPDWTLLRDTVEEPTDVRYDQPIRLASKSTESENSAPLFSLTSNASLEHSASAPLVRLSLLLCVCRVLCCQLFIVLRILCLRCSICVSRTRNQWTTW